MTEEKKELHSGKDFDKYAYFESKAKNYAKVMKSKVEEVLSSGQKRVAKADEDEDDYEKGEKMIGLRIEFHNHNYRIERTKKNVAIIKHLVDLCRKEAAAPLRFQQVKQIFKPIKMVSETKMNSKLDEKDAEIEALKAELGKDKIEAPKTEEEKDLSQVV